MQLHFPNFLHFRIHKLGPVGIEGDGAHVFPETKIETISSLIAFTNTMIVNRY